MTTSSWLRHVGRRAIPTGVCLVALAGCGGSDPEPSELVEASLLRIEDLPQPEEWSVEEEKEESPEEARLDEQIEECEKRHDPTTDSAQAEKVSDSFTRAELETASSTGAVVREAELRDAFFDTLEDQLSCDAEALRTYLGPQVEVAEPYRLDIGRAGSRSEGWSVQVGGFDETIFLDLVAVEQGKLLAAYVFLHTGDLTQDQLLDVIERGVERVRDVEGR